MTSYLIQELGLENSPEHWGEIQLRLQPINDFETVESYDLTLPATAHNWFEYHNKESEQQLQLFLTKLSFVIDSLSQPGNGYDESPLYMRLYEAMTFLSDRSGTKKLISFSDLLFNERDGVSYLNYESAPNRMWEERESLIETMKKSKPPLKEELSGILWKNFYSPTDRLNDKLHSQSQRIFRQMVEPYGVIAEFKANLPGEMLRTKMAEASL